jgi:hypothetical protein
VTSKTRESIQEASVSVTLPKFSLSLIESPTFSPYELPSEEPEEPEEIITGPSNLPVHPEHKPQHYHAPSERARSPTPLITDVPLPMVHDIILALLRNKTAIELTVESICVAHDLNPLITESVMQVVRENLSAVDERQGYVVSQLTSARRDD